jgi:hypothetical protein
MIKRRRDDLTSHLTGLAHARARCEARGATPEDMDTLDHELAADRKRARQVALQGGRVGSANPARRQRLAGTSPSRLSVEDRFCGAAVARIAAIR